MLKTDIKIWIIEDDKNFAKSLKEAIDMAGFNATVFNSPNDALASLKLNPPHAIVSDCMLPVMSGVDFIVKVHELESKPIPCILMSGIYTDKSFIKDALVKTKAVGFLAKPFDLDHLIQRLEDCFGEDIEEPLPAFLELICKPNITRADITKALDSLESLPSVEIPRLLATIMSFQIPISLELTDNQQKTSKISLNQGKIVSVQVADPKSIFGALIVEKNYLNHEELELALQAPIKKRVGEKLVHQNLISPHVIDLINAEQMAIRLSYLITENSYRVKYKTEQIPVHPGAIDINLLTSFMVDWLNSKFTTPWLEKFYIPWYENPFVLHPDLTKQHPIFLSETLIQTPQLKDILQNGESLSSLEKKTHLPNGNLYRAIHLLLMRGLLQFDATVKQEDIGGKISRLKNLWADMQNQDYFQILGINQKAKGSEIKKNFHEIAKLFHPDKLPPESPEDLRSLTKNIFSLMTRAYETLNDSHRKKKYIQELEQGQAELRLQAEALFEEAKDHLNYRRPQAAKTILDKAMRICPPTSEILLHHLWALVATLSETEDKEKALLQINNELNKVPPEDRHDATYYFVKGIFQKQIGEVKMAINNLKHAISLRPNFIEAKRELNILKLKDDTLPIDLLRADLGDVAKHLIKKMRK